MGQSVWHFVEQLLCGTYAFLTNIRVANWMMLIDFTLVDVVVDQNCQYKFSNDVQSEIESNIFCGFC